MQESTAVMKFRFSQRQIDAIPAQAREAASSMAEYSDTEVIGLKLAVSKSGRKFFWHRYRLRGRKRMIKLGEYPSLSLSEARQMVNENKAIIARDLDPADERNRRRSIPTLAEFVREEYLPYAQQHKRSWKDDEYKLRKEIGEAMGHLTLPEITTRDVMQLHASIRKKGTAATANRYLSLLSRVFSLAIKWGHLERNPARNVDKFREAPPRRRFLSGDELSRFLQALDAESGKTTANALKLLLMTGLRKMELLSLPWSEVNLEKGSIRLTRTKNGNVRDVVLNSVALELMKEIRGNAEPSCPWVFPARSGDGHLIDVRKPLARAMKRAELTDLRPHDLRRSFASLAVNAGVDLYQIKDLLGHSDVSVTQRAYAHLQQHTLRVASEAVAKTIEEAFEKAA